MNTKTEAPALTKEDVAKLVSRGPVAKLDKEGNPVLDKAGQPVLESAPLKPAEVFAWHDYGTHVVVVTVDGQKLSSAA